MTPDTVTLVAQLIRHNKAMATSLETWVRKHPESQACREMVEMLTVYRGVLTTLEYQVSQFEVDLEPEHTSIDEEVGVAS